MCVSCTERLASGGHRAESGLREPPVMRVGSGDQVLEGELRGGSRVDDSIKRCIEVRVSKAASTYARLRCDTPTPPGSSPPPAPTASEHSGRKYPSSGSTQALKASFCSPLTRMASRASSSARSLRGTPAWPGT